MVWWSKPYVPRSSVVIFWPSRDIFCHIHCPKTQILQLDVAAIKLYWFLLLCLKSLPIGIVILSVLQSSVFLQLSCTAVIGGCGTWSSCFCYISSTTPSLETVHSSVCKRQTFNKNRKSFRWLPLVCTNIANIVVERVQIDYICMVHIW